MFEGPKILQVGAKFDREIDDLKNFVCGKNIYIFHFYLPMLKWTGVLSYNTISGPPLSPPPLLPSLQIRANNTVQGATVLGW